MWLMLCCCVIFFYGCILEQHQYFNHTSVHNTTTAALEYWAKRRLRGTILVYPVSLIVLWNERAADWNEKTEQSPDIGPRPTGRRRIRKWQSIFTAMFFTCYSSFLVYCFLVYCARGHDVRRSKKQRTPKRKNGQKYHVQTTHATPAPTGCTSRNARTKIKKNSRQRNYSTYIAKRGRGGCRRARPPPAPKLC